MTGLDRAETEFQYTRPHAALFREDMARFAHAGKVMHIRPRADDWFARFQEKYGDWDAVEGSLPPYYLCLFNQVTDAVADLKAGNYGLARERLLRAQKEAEELYMG